jgi:phage terminase large subunit
LNGIDIVKRYRLNVMEESIELKDELDNYTWKQDHHTAEFLNVPVDKYNHYLDSLRYIALNKLQVSAPPAKPQKQFKGIQRHSTW